MWQRDTVGFYVTKVRIVIGACEAINYLVNVSLTNIAAHNRKVSDLLRDGLIERGVQVLSPEDPGERSAIVAARFNGDNTDIARSLASNRVFISPRKDFIRFSPHLFNGKDDILNALDVIDAITEK